MTENKQSEEVEFGPPGMSFSTFLLKLLAGLAGGIGGSLILLLIFFLANAFLNQELFNPITNYDEENINISPIFTFVLIMMIFLSSTIGNITSTWIMALTERGRYTRIASAIYQVFIISIIIFILMVPVYFFTAATKFSIVPYVVALQIIISAQVSALILEIVSNYKYSLVGVYGITFSIIGSAGILFALSGIIENPQILLFAALPIVWGSIGFVQSIFTMIYGWLARTYDKDFLSTQTVYGSDYGREVEDTEPEAAKAQDEAGADFLRHRDERS